MEGWGCCCYLDWERELAGWGLQMAPRAHWRLGAPRMLLPVCSTAEVRQVQPSAQVTSPHPPLPPSSLIFTSSSRLHVHSLSTPSIASPRNLLEMYCLKSHWELLNENCMSQVPRWLEQMSPFENQCSCLFQQQYLWPSDYAAKCCSLCLEHCPLILSSQFDSSLRLCQC